MTIKPEQRIDVGTSAKPSYTRDMTAVDLPDEALKRLSAEAARRGMTVADVIANFAATLPLGPRPNRKIAFIGVGASGSGTTHQMDELLADGFGRS